MESYQKIFREVNFNYDKKAIRDVKKSYFSLVDFYRLPQQNNELITDISHQMRMNADDIENILQMENLI